MTNYAEYEYYTTTYGGTVFDSANLFNRYSRKASLLMDKATMERITNDTELQALDEVKMCACEIAEYLYKVDCYIDKNILTASGTDADRAVSSITSGSESVHYDTGTNTSSVSMGAASEKERNNAIYAIISTYCGALTDANGINLVYWGD